MMRRLILTLALTVSLISSVSAQVSFIPKHNIMPLVCYPFQQIDLSIKANGYKVADIYDNLIFGKPPDPNPAPGLLYVYKNEKTGGIVFLQTGPRDMPEDAKTACIFAEGYLEGMKPEKPIESPKDTEITPKPGEPNGGATPGKYQDALTIPH